MRIVLIGSPASGKTTLSAELFVALKQAGRNAELVSEWIRGDIAQHGPMRSIWEQYRTRQHQKELEDAVPAEVSYVICDGGVLLQYFYACLYSDPNEPRQRVVLQDMYRYLLDDLYLRRYDMIFYLPSLHTGAIHDGIRYQTASQILALDQHIELLFTKIHAVPEVHRVSGGFDARLQEVLWRVIGADETLTPDEVRAKVILLVNKLKQPADFG